MEQERFPSAHRRQPKFVGFVFEFAMHARRKLLRRRQAPNPNVCIEQEFQSLSASIVSGSITGDTMSPMISTLSDMEPIQLLSPASADAGITSAMALPRRVTRSGVFVLLTCSSSARHFALNSEMATSWIEFLDLLGMCLL